MVRAICTWVGFGFGKWVFHFTQFNRGSYCFTGISTRSRNVLDYIWGYFSWLVLICGTLTTVIGLPPFCSFVVCGLGSTVIVFASIVGYSF